MVLLTREEFKRYLNRAKPRVAPAPVRVWSHPHPRLYILSPASRETEFFTPCEASTESAGEARCGIEIGRVYSSYRDANGANVLRLGKLR